MKEAAEADRSLPPLDDAASKVWVERMYWAGRVGIPSAMKAHFPML